MLKKIIASRTNKENERPPLGHRRNLKEPCGWEKDGDSHGQPMTQSIEFLQEQIQQKRVEKLEHINKRWQAESTIADKDAFILEEQAKREVADEARAKAEAKAAKLAAKLRALGIDPEDV